jgi:hypothetical protein
VAEAVAARTGESAVSCCMAWFLFRWLNNACSVEIQRGTDKELNQELAGKSQFLVAPGSGCYARPGATNKNGEPPESEWLAVRAVEGLGQTVRWLLAFCGAAQGIQ